MILFQPTMLLSLTFLLFLSFRVRLLYWRLIYSPPDFRKKHLIYLKFLENVARLLSAAVGVTFVLKLLGKDKLLCGIHGGCFFFFIPAEKTHSARWERQIPLGPLTPMEIEKENGKRSEFCLCITAGIYIFVLCENFLTYCYKVLMDLLGALYQSRADFTRFWNELLQLTFSG